MPKAFQVHLSNPEFTTNHFSFYPCCFSGKWWPFPWASRRVLRKSWRIFQRAELSQKVEVRSTFWENENDIVSLNKTVDREDAIPVNEIGWPTEKLLLECKIFNDRSSSQKLIQNNRFSWQDWQTLFAVYYNLECRMWGWTSFDSISWHAEHRRFDFAKELVIEVRRETVLNKSSSSFNFSLICKSAFSNKSYRKRNCYLC